MKESLFDIFQRNRDCYDNRHCPTTDIFRERTQAANEYVSNLISLGRDWIEAVKYDVKQMTECLPPSLHFDKTEREAYRDGVKDFLLNVATALREHGKEMFLNDEYFDVVTLYRLGIFTTDWKELQTGLSMDEAKQMVKEMKQRYSQVYCFPDLFSMFPATYTVFGYKDKASTPEQAQNKANSNAKGNVMGSNTTAKPKTQPAAQEMPMTVEMYEKRPKGRPILNFDDTIADTYKGKTDTIQEHTKAALEKMTDPKAVIALFILYLQNKIIKQCPTYWQTLRLLKIEEKLSPFNTHHCYDKQKKIYFKDSDNYMSLNEIDQWQQYEIKAFVTDAQKEVEALLSKLKTQPLTEARKEA